MAKPFSFRHKHRSDLVAIKGPWLVEGPNRFSFEVLDRTDAALLAKKLNDVGPTEAGVLTKKLSEPSRPKRHHATKKSPTGLAAAQRAYISAVEDDVRSYPSAYKAHVRDNPGAWAMQHIEGLDEDDVRRLTREQRAETKLTARLSSPPTKGALHHAAKKSPAQLQREINDTLAGLGLPSTHGRENALEYAQRRANATKTAYAISKMGHVMPADSDNKRLMRDDLGGIALIVKPSR